MRAFYHLRAQSVPIGLVTPQHAHTFGCFVLAIFTRVSVLSNFVTRKLVGRQELLVAGNVLALVAWEIAMVDIVDFKFVLL
jgi:hypothetical protein